MKVSRRVLKQIVKECLVEILTEGLGAVSGPTSHQSTVPLDSLMSPRQLPEHYSPPPQRQPPARPMPNPIANAVKELAHQHPSMAAIFADTARSTLMEQGLSHDSPRAATIDPRADRAAKIVDAVPPEQLFGEETASKWASLAFMPSNKKL
jgi:hypothetical protein